MVVKEVVLMLKKYSVSQHARTDDKNAQKTPDFYQL